MAMQDTFTPAITVPNDTDRLIVVNALHNFGLDYIAAATEAALANADSAAAVQMHVNNATTISDRIMFLIDALTQS